MLIYCEYSESHHDMISFVISCQETISAFFTETHDTGGFYGIFLLNRHLFFVSCRYINWNK